MADNIQFDAAAVQAAVQEGIDKLNSAATLDELHAIRSEYAGNNSAMAQASKAIGSLAADQKKEAGKVVGKLRADFGRAYAQRETALKEEAERIALAAETVDMTQPVRRNPLGARHPLP